MDKLKMLERCALVQSADVRLAALFDFLIGSCDCTSSNFIVTEKGRIKLIDNLDSAFHSYAYSWKGRKICSSGLRSVFIQQFVDADVWESARRAMPCLDYRCHAPNGKIGREYPPIFKRCTANISGMSDRDVWRSFQLPSLRIAERLREISIWLLRGFEYAVYDHFEKYGENRSQ